MTAYLIVRVEVTDPVQYEEYKKLTPGAIAAAGGRFIVRGGDHETFEGENETRRIVVAEFPSMEAARAFYDSDLYRVARTTREGAANMQIVAVQGA